MKKFTYMIPETLMKPSHCVNHTVNAAMYVAGGTDVLVKVKSGKIAPDYLISLKHILGLSQVSVNQDTGELHIGAFVTHRTLENPL